MKKLITIFTISFVFLLTSCANNGCRVCKDNPNAPGVRAEVCPDRITTYHNNSVLADEQNPNSVAIAVISLEASGYKCN